VGASTFKNFCDLLRDGAVAAN